ncbi:hypothetical protein H8S95_06245 [Pontibacter sp. KCTC 32443]|uniref:bestrophin-like domain n=1 Tax=Pontibacter TaxID=323449 RepID=UPI00164CE631|nr:MULTISPECIES: hypothetical protein [Pontibacter]MBC5773656.1 hypothetical protein [Pontibacter sp. KCTC 32443]
MKIGLLITSLPSWALFILIVIIGVLAALAGIHIALKKAPKEVKVMEATIGTDVGAMLALLAFMLGFTFSITSSRFAERKELVIQQANAIGTCYLRTSFLPEKQKKAIRGYFLEYIGILVKLPRQPDKDVIKKATQRMDAINLLLWKQTASLAQANMDSELRAAFIESVNEVIDVYSERETVALVFRIPDLLWFSLILLYLLSLFAMGYQNGTYKNRGVIDIAFLAAAFALVIVMIADMDSSTKPTKFKVSQQPLENTQKLIQTYVP